MRSRTRRVLERIEAEFGDETPDAESMNPADLARATSKAARRKRFEESIEAMGDSTDE